MAAGWPAVNYEDWAATCDTLHAHTQVLGKLAARLAAPEPQLQHAALRLSARGWETAPLPAPDGSGAFTVVLDLHHHVAVVDHVDGRSTQVPLAPNRPVGAVTREVIAAVVDLVGPVPFDPRPQETSWQTPLDSDEEHATYDEGQVAAYFVAATQAAGVLAALRAPYRGRSTPVNAWWGSFDLAVSLFSGSPANPPSDDFIARNAETAEYIAVGWWPGDQRFPRAAFYGYAFPSPPSLSAVRLDPPAARFDDHLGEFVLDWDDIREVDDPRGAALGFGRSLVRHACRACGWDESLMASVDSVPPPVI